MSTPHRCPVCEGRQTVEHQFYHPAASSSGNPFAPVPCRTCKATGVIWAGGVIVPFVQTDGSEVPKDIKITVSVPPIPENGTGWVYMNGDNRSQFTLTGGVGN